MTNFPRSAYGSNPNAGRPGNGDAAAWGGWQWPNCPPSNLLGRTDFTSRFGERLQVTVRRELVELLTLSFQIADMHNYRIFSSVNGVNWGPWGMDCRPVSGTSTPSGHSMGLSWDANAPNNPFSTTWQSDMPPPMVTDLQSLGWFWGGWFSPRFDPMHYGYCFPPASVAGHVTRARQLLGAQPTPEPDKESRDMALVITASDAARPHLFMQGTSAIQLVDGGSTAALQAAGIPFAAIRAVDWDRIRTKYEVDPVEATIV